MMRQTITNALAFIALALVLIAGPAGALTYTWNAGNNEYTNSSNWTPAGPPPAADTAQFNGSTADNITFAQSVTNVQALVYYAGRVLFNLLGNTYTLTGGGYGGVDVQSCTLVLTNGTVNSAGMHVGGALGTVTVDGLGSLLKVTGTSNLGGTGAGVLNVTNGATLDSGNSDFAMWAPMNATISGPGSTWINRGYWRAMYGTPTLNILDGGQLVLSNYFITGFGGVGPITVSGPGSQINQIALQTFTLSLPMVVSNGANVIAKTLVIDDSSNPLDSARLTVDGATMTNNGWSTIIGSTKTGTMIVTNGGRVYSQFGWGLTYDCDMAATAASTSTVTITGAGSRWDVTHNLNVGGYFSYYGGTPNGYNWFVDGGVGRLTVGPGAVVMAAAGYVHVGSRGTVDLDGGTLIAPNGLELRIPGAQLIGNGTIGANVYVTNGATLAPGHSVGTLTISNSLALSSLSTSVFDIAGSACDLAQVKGNLTAGGTLHISLSNPVPGRYVLFSVTGTSSGSFAQTNWTGVNGRSVTANFIGKDYVVYVRSGSQIWIR